MYRYVEGAEGTNEAHFEAYDKFHRVPLRTLRELLMAGGYSLSGNYTQINDAVALFIAPLTQTPQVWKYIDDDGNEPDSLKYNTREELEEMARHNCQCDRCTAARQYLQWEQATAKGLPIMDEGDYPPATQVADKHFRYLQEVSKRAGSVQATMKALNLPPVPYELLHEAAKKAVAIEEANTASTPDAPTAQVVGAGELSYASLQAAMENFKKTKDDSGTPLYTTPTHIVVDEQKVKDFLSRPAHYKDYGKYEPLKVMRAWLAHHTDPFVVVCISMALKHLARAGRKPGNSVYQDVDKANEYLSRLLRRLKKQGEA